MTQKQKILVGILGILVLGGIAFGFSRYRQRQVQPLPPSSPEETCIKTGTEEEMTLSDAKNLALESECVEEGSLTDEYFCNEDTGTWWLDLDIDKPGCAPACVVNVATGKAEINWRCTGLIPE